MFLYEREISSTITYKIKLFDYNAYLTFSQIYKIANLHLVSFFIFAIFKYDCFDISKK